MLFPSALFDALRAGRSAWSDAAHAPALEEGLRGVGRWMEPLAGRAFGREAPFEVALDALASALRAAHGGEVGEVRVELLVRGEGVAVRLVIPTEGPVGLSAPWRALRARTLDPRGARTLLRALGALPDRYRVGPLASGRNVAATPMAPERFRRLLDEAEVHGAPLAVELAVPRDEVLTRAGHAADDFEAALLALAPLHRIVTGRAASEPARRRRSGRAVGGSSRGRERPRALADEDAIAESLAAEEGGPPSLPVPDESPAEGGIFPRVLPPRGTLRVTIRQGPFGAFDRNAPIEAGAKVVVLGGVFAGKSGVVQELDGRGGARVFLGLFATLIPVVDLARARDGRPAIASSHRRRTP